MIVHVDVIVVILILVEHTQPHRQQILICTPCTLTMHPDDGTEKNIRLPVETSRIDSFHQQLSLNRLFKSD